MAKIERLGAHPWDGIDEFFRQVNDGEITHSVAAYRRDNGDLCYSFVGAEDMTYLLGMMFRTMSAMDQMASTQAEGTLDDD